jgi:hypothetical protein
MIMIWGFDVGLVDAFRTFQDDHFFAHYHNLELQP